MVLRSSKAAVLALGLMFVLRAPGQDLTFEVRHDHLRGYGTGTLRVSDSGLTFAETGPKATHKWTLGWTDIQQLAVGPARLKVLTYEDTWWKLGADRQYELEAARDVRFTQLYSALKGKLDQRLVAELADKPEDALWRIPAKLRERFGGPEGVVTVADDRVVFDSRENGKSRTWRLADIENISSSGPFDLTFTTYERSRGDWGDRRSFTFQLKEPLSEARYNGLWRRLNRSKQLQFISSIQETQQ